MIKTLTKEEVAKYPNLIEKINAGWKLLIVEEEREDEIGIAAFNSKIWRAYLTYKRKRVMTKKDEESSSYGCDATHRLREGALRELNKMAPRAYSIEK